MRSFDSPAPYGSPEYHMVEKAKFRTPRLTSATDGASKYKSKQTLRPKVTLKSVRNVTNSGSMVRCACSSYKWNLRYLRKIKCDEFANSKAKPAKIIFPPNLLTYLAMVAP